MASASGERLSSADFRKKKEIEEARKAGTLPPEQDEEGNMINPHNPEYITKRPWYLGESGPSLKHQTVQKEKVVLSLAEAESLHRKGRFKHAATKYRKGACKNCGALTHKTTECVERPRSKGAWKTNKDIRPDEVIRDVRSETMGKLSYDGKRDSWLGVDAAELMRNSMAQYQKAEEERKRKKLEQMQKKKLAKSAARRERAKQRGPVGSDSDSDSDSDYESDAESEDEDFRDREGGKVHTTTVQRQGGVGGAQMKVTVRNLRIREDTAKYLRNLDPNSAYYDPKTRSMRDNPNPNVSAEDLPFAGDNFVRYSGDTKKLAQTQLFAWEANERGIDLHPQANPSQAELLRKQFEEKEAKLEKSQKERILEKYGSAELTKSAPSELLLAQSENYVEYSRDGRVIKGLEKAKVKSKYEEDVYMNNHTAVWGSWFDRSSLSWGYNCCHLLVKNSYCTGEAGKEASEQAQAEVHVRAMLPPRQETLSAEKAPSKADLYGENLSPELDQAKLQKALAKEEKFQKKKAEVDDRKRHYNSMASTDVTAEEMEAYKMKKVRHDDPMKDFLS